MLRAFERAWIMCKSGDLSVGHFPAAYDPIRRPLSRAAFWGGLSLFLLLSAFLADALVGQLLTLAPAAHIWRRVAEGISKTGEGWVVGVAGIVGSVFFFFRGRLNPSRTIFLVAFTGLMTGATATILRSLLGRTRPDSHEMQGFYGIWHDSHFIIGKYEFGAFPSGHAATVIGLATAAWLINRRFGLVAGVYALLVTWSRIALGCHHFSDAVAAGIVGIYGAHWILARLGPSIYCFANCLQAAWAGRKARLIRPIE